MAWIVLHLLLPLMNSFNNILAAIFPMHAMLCRPRTSGPTMFAAAVEIRDAPYAAIVFAFFGIKFNPCPDSRRKLGRTAVAQGARLKAE